MKNNKNEEENFYEYEKEENSLIPPEYRHTGFGDWSSVNGNRRFLELALQHYRIAYARCIEHEMDIEANIFHNHIQDLQAILIEIDNVSIEEE